MKTAPKTPMELVTDAQAAMKRDPKLKEGLAFEGSKYEGFVTVFVDLLRAFGGNFDPAHFNTPQNLKALTFLHDLVYKYKCADRSRRLAGDASRQRLPVRPERIRHKLAVRSAGGLRQELDVPLSGKGNVGFAPFPSVNGHGVATDLRRCADRQRQEHASRRRPGPDQVRDEPGTQQARAITSGDPPSVRSAYNASLFRKAPYFSSDLNVFKAGYPDS